MVAAAPGPVLRQDVTFLPGEPAVGAEEAGPQLRGASVCRWSCILGYLSDITAPQNPQNLLSLLDSSSVSLFFF